MIFWYAVSGYWWSNIRFATMSVAYSQYIIICIYKQFLYRLEPNSQLGRVSCRARVWWLYMVTILVTISVKKLSCSLQFSVTYSVATWLPRHDDKKVTSKSQFDFIDCGPGVFILYRGNHATVKVQRFAENNVCFATLRKNHTFWQFIDCQSYSKAISG